jgi:hypothetical protein
LDFIDVAIEKQRVRLSTAKPKQKPERNEAEKEEVEIRDKEIRELVDQCISKVITPLIIEAKKRFEQNAFKSEADLDTSNSIDMGRTYAKGIKLQLNKTIYRKTGIPIVAGPSLSFSASPPYSTTIAIVAYGENNKAIFSDRWEIEEVNEKLVVEYIKLFVEEVIR